jgi:transposase
MVRLRRFLYFLTLFARIKIAVSFRLLFSPFCMVQEIKFFIWRIGLISSIFDDMKKIVEEKNRKKFNYFIGIDISKGELDFAVLKGTSHLFHKEIRNDPEEILSFLRELKTHPQYRLATALFCMENTGLYGNHLQNALQKIKANFVVENPTRIKNSMGLLRGKNDKLDAARIAAYAEKNQADLRFWQPFRSVIMRLKAACTLRERLLGVSVVLKTPLREQIAFVSNDLQQLCVEYSHKTLTAVRADLVGVNNYIDALICSDERLKRLNGIMTSVPGVGRITALHIILCTNEFRNITDPRKFACYAGIAPFQRESGKIKGKARISHIANKKMKSLLHICALIGIRRNQEFKPYYDRKTILEGKHPIMVLNAIRNKVVKRVFACVNQDRYYEKNFSVSQDSKNPGVLNAHRQQMQ